MYALRLVRSARKELEALPDAMLTRIARQLDALPDEPRPKGCKKLRGATRATAAACLLLAACSGLSAAQRTATSERRDLGNLGGDIWAVWTSPVHMQRGDLAPIGASIGALALTALGDSVIGAWMASHQNVLAMRALSPFRNKWIVPLNKLPTAPYALPLAAVAYTAGRLTDNPALSNAGLGCAATNIASAGARIAIYSTMARARPLRTSDPFELSFPGSSDWTLHSFTGGHVANATACATFLSHRYSLGAAEPLLFLYAAGIGLGRMADGAHWASDTITGVLLGVAIGTAVAHRQQARSLRDAAAGPAAASMGIPLFRAQITF